jgi:hypothetical protein
MLLFSALLTPAHAVVPLTPRPTGAKRMSATVTTKGAPITTEDFKNAILDCDHYPLNASYMGVKALLECHTLAKQDGYTIIYQRTGGNSFISSRQYVIALKVVEQSDAKVRIEWDLVQHSCVDGTCTGPFASALNAHTDAVYTPGNTGGWTYDKTAGTITYWAQSDPGGTVPGWLVSQEAVTAFPLELLKTRWGVTP